MRVVFKRDLSKKYICSICGKQFNWDNKSSRYGDLENTEAVFCNDVCANKFLNEKSAEAKRSEPSCG